MKIKNWKQFQHYPAELRRPPWIKLHKTILDDRSLWEMSAADFRLLIALWLIASEEAGNLPPINDLAFRLRLSNKQITALLQRLSAWLEPCEHDASTPLAERYQDARLIKNREDREDIEEKENRSRKRSLHSLPENWTPMEELSTQDAFELEKMRNWAKANDIRKADWIATWRNWKITAEEYRQGRQRPLRALPIGGASPEAYAKGWNERSKKQLEERERIEKEREIGND